MQLSDKIIGLRKFNTMSQEELAEKLKVSRQTISRWEIGSAMPDATNILHISKLFGVTADSLLNDDAESDNSLLKTKEIKQDHSNQILLVLVTLEGMVLLMQFMATIILQNVFFGCLSFIPFVALICGFEFAYQKKIREKGNKNRQATAFFRKRFYKMSAWLGLYFPIRFLSMSLMTFYPRPYSAMVLECIVLSLYLGAALLVCASIETHGKPSS